MNATTRSNAASSNGSRAASARCTSNPGSAAVRETARVLEPGGRLCLAIVHPINSAGVFQGDAAGSPFVIDGSYLDRFHYRDDMRRDGLEIAFVSEHRPLQAYTDALTDAGLLIERLREPPVPEEAVTVPRNRRWQRLALFLHMRAVKAHTGDSP